MQYSTRYGSYYATVPVMLLYYYYSTRCFPRVAQRQRRRQADLYDCEIARIQYRVQNSR